MNKQRNDMKHWFWQHNFKIVKVSKGYDISHVLYRCECGALDTKTFIGCWDLKDLNPELETAKRKEEYE